jgi:hypothetical protein
MPAPSYVAMYVHVYEYHRYPNLETFEAGLREAKADAESSRLAKDGYFIAIYTPSYIIITSLLSPPFIIIDEVTVNCIAGWHI